MELFYAILVVLALASFKEWLLGIKKKKIPPKDETDLFI